MSRGAKGAARPVVVWLLASGATAAAAAAVPTTWTAARSASGAEGVADVLVATCATGLVLALAWLWLVTTTTVAALLTGRTGTGGGTTRRLVLLACGVAVMTGATVPAQASGGDGSELLVGLSLPERAVAPARHRPERADPARVEPAGTYVVRPGDSLSSIALAHPSDGPLEDRWRAIWRANRDVVGDDPDLILPGQALRLPPARRPSTHRTPHTRQDGDR